MARLLKDKNLDAVARAQAEPARPHADSVLHAVAKASALSPLQLLGRTDQRAFQIAVYLLRRAVNLSLKQTAALANISPSRVSRIQADMERSQPDKVMAELLDKYQIKH
jgi:DNA-directed RNA polymerase specialized sigma subunit